MPGKTKYNLEATAAHVEASPFHIGEFIETFYSGGRLIGQEKHEAIPAGRKLGAEGEQTFTLQEQRMFRHPTKGNVMRFPKIKVTSRLDAICGRMKKNIHNEAQSLL